MTLGGELRKQISQLRWRSAALQERHRSLTSRYNELQKKCSELRKITAEHRKAITDKFSKARPSKASVHIFPKRAEAEAASEGQAKQGQIQQPSTSGATSKAA